jgi:hypothetical protein
MVHYGDYTVRDIKAQMHRAGVPVRLDARLDSHLNGVR